MLLTNVASWYWDNSSGTSDWTLLYTLTTVGTRTVWTSPTDWNEYGLFIVGGGASGHSEFSKSRSGTGGNGGVVLSKIIQVSNPEFELVVSGGGPATATGTNKASNAGKPSYITVDGVTYTADGGLGKSTTDMSANTKVVGSGMGATGIGNTDHTPYFYKISSSDTEGRMGEDGLPNPFDPNDPLLYGPGGGAGISAYYYSSSSCPSPGYFAGGAGHVSDSTVCGGKGGYGANNATTNAGSAATVYGGGGGGGAFSGGHTYGSGGAGFQGIIKIYGRNS